MAQIREGIAEITLPEAVFQTRVFQPAAVNLICGRNGTGKSTFAEQLRHPEQFRFAAEKCGILHFDRHFIRNNIRQYANMPGVLIISRNSAELLALRRSLREKRRRTEELLREQEPARQALEADSAEEMRRLAELCWQRTRSLRERFPALEQQQKDASRLAETLLYTMPRYGDISGISARYQKAFETEARIYPAFRCIAQTHCLDRPAGAELLAEPVVSSRDSAFARFISNLHAADWVQQGHIRYAESAAGICPYCQQKLPADFEAKLADCFDSAFQQTLQALNRFQAQYRQAANELFLPLQENLKTCLPDYDYTRYSDLLKLLRQTISTNLERIRHKLQNPSECVRLEPVAMLNESINREIIKINKAVRKNNQFKTESRKIRSDSLKEILAYIAYILRDDIAVYQSRRAQIEMCRQLLDEQRAAYQAELDALSAQYRECAAQNADPDTAVRTMNKLLAAAGFSDFRLERRSSLTYAVVRPNGAPAGMLSEGEQRFLAFLYYYHLLLAESENGTPHIAVIDDPFTALDREAAGIVCKLIQKLLPLCGNTAAPLVQIFVLTCQPPYHLAFVQAALQKEIPASFCIFRKTAKGTQIEPMNL